MFYPVDVDRNEGKVMRHAFPDKFLEGNAKKGKPKAGFEHASIKNRQVKQLCPLAPLANDFATGAKKLIPMVFNHGNGVTNEAHYGVPMIMASHGYFVVSPNHRRVNFLRKKKLKI